MRRLLALLALAGLLLSPAAASAAALRCMSEHGNLPRVEHGGAPTAEAADAAHVGCVEDGKPSEHDPSACARDCALMAGVSVALPETGDVRILGFPAPRLVPRTAGGVRPFAPPGPKRPPRSIA